LLRINFVTLDVTLLLSTFFCWRRDEHYAPDRSRLPQLAVLA
jgi:hypothetical protein